MINNVLFGGCLAFHSAKIICLISAPIDIILCYFVCLFARCGAAMNFDGVLRLCAEMLLLL